MRRGGSGCPGETPGESPNSTASWAAIMDRTKRLLEHLLANPGTSESDGVASKLLTEYQRGSPVESLRVLLLSEDDRLAGEGAWIASELSEKGLPLLQEVGTLLQHRSKKVRFWVLDCILLWAGPQNGPELASAVTLVDDPERAVRWKALNFLAMISRDQLEAAFAQMAKYDPTSPHLSELRWMLGAKGSDSKEILAGLHQDDARHRRFAAAAAARLIKSDPVAILSAAALDDPEIAQFAGDMLKRNSVG